MTVQFGRVVFPLDGSDNRGTAKRLATHLRVDKGIDTEVVELNNQGFVLTGGDLRAARSIREKHNRTAAELLNKIEHDAKGQADIPDSTRDHFMITGAHTTRILSNGERDWGRVATGPEGYPQDYGIAAKAEQIEDSARQMRTQLRSLLAKAQLWFPNAENNLVKGEMYKGPEKRALLAALLGTQNSQEIRDTVSGITRNLLNDRFQATRTAEA